jgi:hypothetical protein
VAISAAVILAFILPLVSFSLACPVRVAKDAERLSAQGCLVLVQRQQSFLSCRGPGKVTEVVAEGLVQTSRLSQQIWFGQGTCPVNIKPFKVG